MTSRVKNVDESRKQLQCSFCDRRCFTLAAMSGHMRMLHRKPYSCDMCFAWFSNDDDRQEHTQLFHRHPVSTTGCSSNNNGASQSVDAVSSHSSIIVLSNVSLDSDFDDDSSSLSNISSFTYSDTDPVLNSAEAGEFDITTTVGEGIDNRPVLNVSQPTEVVQPPCTITMSDDDADNQDEFSCGYCKSIFTSALELVTHMSLPHIVSTLVTRSCNGIDKTAQIHFLCQICGHDFNGSTNYEQHAKERHATNDMINIIENQQAHNSESHAVDRSGKEHSAISVADNEANLDKNAVFEYYTSKRLSTNYDETRLMSPDVNSVYTIQLENSIPRQVSLESDPRKRQLCIGTDTHNGGRSQCKAKRVESCRSDDKRRVSQNDDSLINHATQRYDHIIDVTTPHVDRNCSDILENGKCLDTVCGICKDIMSCKQALYTHMNVVHGIVMSEHTYCSLCGCHLESQNDLAEHMSVIHKTSDTNDERIASISCKINRDERNAPYSTVSDDYNMLSVDEIQVNKTIKAGSKHTTTLHRNGRPINSAINKNRKRTNIQNMNFQYCKQYLNRNHIDTKVTPYGDRLNENESTVNYNHRDQDKHLMLNLEHVSDRNEFVRSMTSANENDKSCMEDTSTNDVIMDENVVDTDSNNKNAPHFMSCPICGWRFDVIRDLVYHIAVHKRHDEHKPTYTRGGDREIITEFPSSFSENSNSDIICNNDQPVVLDLSPRGIGDDTGGHIGTDDDVIVIEDVVNSKKSTCLDPDSSEIGQVNIINRDKCHRSDTKGWDSVANIDKITFMKTSGIETHRTYKHAAEMNNENNPTIINNVSSRCYTCSVCGSSFTSDEGLDEHLATHRRCNFGLIHPKILAAFKMRHIYGTETENNNDIALITHNEPIDPHVNDTNGKEGVVSADNCGVSGDVTMRPVLSQVSLNLQELDIKVVSGSKTVNSVATRVNNDIYDDMSPVTCMRKRMYDGEDPEKSDNVDDLKTCSLCGFAFNPDNFIAHPPVSSRYLVLQHLTQNHNVSIKLTFPCRLCGAYLSTYPEFEQHIHKHEEYFWHLRSPVLCFSSAFYCEMCLFDCFTIAKLTRHIKTHNNHKLSAAAIIEKVDSNHESEITGTSAKNMATDGPMQSSVMDKLRLTLSTTSELAHELITTCDICESTIPSRVSMVNHLLVAHNVNIITYHTCNICDKVINLHSSFTSHCRQHEIEAKAKLRFSAPNQLFRCATCSVLFRDVLELLSHMQHGHNTTDPRPRKRRANEVDWIHCKECNKTIRSTEFSRHANCRVFGTNYARDSAPPLTITSRQSTHAKNNSLNEGTLISHTKVTSACIKHSDCSAGDPNNTTETRNGFYQPIDEVANYIDGQKETQLKDLYQDPVAMKEVNSRREIHKQDTTGVVKQIVTESTNCDSMINTPKLLNNIVNDTNRNILENSINETGNESRVIDYIKTKERLFEVSVNDIDDDILVISDDEMSEIRNSDRIRTNHEVSVVDGGLNVDTPHQSCINRESRVMNNDTELAIVEERGSSSGAPICIEDDVSGIDAHVTSMFESAKHDTGPGLIKSKACDCGHESLKLINNSETVSLKGKPVIKHTIDCLVENRHTSTGRTKSEQKVADLIQNYLIGRFQLKCKPSDL